MSLVEIFHLNMLPKNGAVAVAEKVRSWNKADHSHHLIQTSPDSGP